LKWDALVLVEIGVEEKCDITDVSVETVFSDIIIRKTIRSKLSVKHRLPATPVRSHQHPLPIRLHLEVKERYQNVLRSPADTLY